MQFAKDSFYMALRDRLATLNPQRTIEIAGEQRPAILVVENECAGSTEYLNETFLIDWQQAELAESAGPTGLKCSITLRTAGAEERGGLDRGRLLVTLQEELLAITKVNSAEKQDFGGALPVDLGTLIFWTQPKFGEVEAKGSMLECSASVRVYCYPEDK